MTDSARNPKVEVGSRWMWPSNCYAVAAYYRGLSFVVSDLYEHYCRIKYEDGDTGRWGLDQILANATSLPSAPVAGPTATWVVTGPGRIDGAPVPAPPTPRCLPGCTPARPCRTKDVCPVWREPNKCRTGGVLMWDSKVASDLPPARAPRYPELRHAGMAGLGILSQRVRR